MNTIIVIALTILIISWFYFLSQTDDNITIVNKTEIRKQKDKEVKEEKNAFYKKVMIKDLKEAIYRFEIDNKVIYKNNLNKHIEKVLSECDSENIFLKMDHLFETILNDLEQLKKGE